MMADALHANILYFPHIRIADPGMLKGALCVWDTVYRIVPESVTPNDSDEVREAVDSGRLRNIVLAPEDLIHARTAYTEFLNAQETLPSALAYTLEGDYVPIHEEKMDYVMQQELADVLGSITRSGDWLQLPKGVADGYMLFLSDSVARRRKLAKFTDSESLFVAMQYFDADGSIDGDYRLPEMGENSIASLILNSFVPAGIESAKMGDVLQFCEANAEGKMAFRTAMHEIASKLVTLDDPNYLRDLAEQEKQRLEEASHLTLARIREHFSDFQSLIIYLGLPMAGKIIDVLTGQHDYVGQFACVGVAGIVALTDVAKSRRKEWVSSEASYYGQLRRKFDSKDPIPRPSSSLYRMMEEFVND
jgi:hypothetical protein